MLFSESLKKNRDFRKYIEKEDPWPINIWSCTFWKMELTGIILESLSVKKWVTVW